MLAVGWERKSEPSGLRGTSSSCDDSQWEGVTPAGGFSLFNKPVLRCLKFIMS